MTSIRIPRSAWVVVCDGAKALIMRNDGDVDRLNLEVVETLTQPDEKTSDLGTDRPGQSYSPPGAAPGTMEQTDWHTRAEEAFLTDVAQQIGKTIAAQRPAGLVLVAPPQALGHLRSVLPANVREAITAEVAKDYTQMPVPDIERHLLKLAA